MGFKSYGEFLAKARTILTEDAGSEGLTYIVKYEGKLEEAEGLQVEKIEEGQAKLTFDYPHDYGFCVNLLKDMGVKVLGLELLF